ncbi:MAG TPA: PEP-CTERM sorting domain-containing protein [Steroidobacteraceae bacterium]|nr:PEP-CTERM sorting domain-containing protein [Steroidobacteraceae bacterium]
MKKRFLGILAVALLGGPMAANAVPAGFACVSGSFNDCALATSTLSWSWNGTDFTVSNGGAGYVSEVYFDVSSGMSVSFLGGTGNIFFYSGASPGSLPGGNTVGFASDRSFDSDPGGLHWGIDQGESATFRILGAALNSFDIGKLAAGLHVRSLVTGSASVITATSTKAVPEPGTLALFGLGLVALGVMRRRRAV